MASPAINRIKRPTRCHNDFECFSEIDLTKVGTSRYARHETTEVLMCAYAFDNEPVKQWVPVEGQPIPAELEDAILDDRVRKFAWNKPFEWNIWTHTLGMRTPHSAWRDPMVMALTCSLPGKLDKAGKVMGLSEDFLKKDGKRLINWFSKLRPSTTKQPARRVHWFEKPDLWAEYLEYNRFDVEAERKIYLNLSPYDLPDHEWDLYTLDQEINDRGIPINMRLVENAIQVRDDVIANRLALMREITGLDNPNSVAQLLEWAQGQGYKFFDLKAGHVRRALRMLDDAVTGGDSHPDEIRDLFEVLTMRGEISKTSTKKFDALANMVDEDGRLRNAHQFAGAGRTWRWAGRGFQIQNLARPERGLDGLEWVKLDSGLQKVAGGTQIMAARHVTLLDAEALEMLYASPMDLLSGCVRTVIEAPDGYVFIDADLAAIENVVLGWMSGETKITDVFEKGRDPYIDFATFLYKRPYSDLYAEYKAGDKAKRTIAKPGVLGCGYLLGPGESYEDKQTGEIEATGLLGYAWNMGVKLTQEQAELSVKVWRETYQKAVDFWYDIDRAARKCIRTGDPTSIRDIRFDRKGPFMRMILPSERALHYVRPRLEEWKMPWGEYKLSITYEQLNDRQQWDRISTHPGKLTENCWNSDTLILTDNGIKRIVEVEDCDLVWDGVEWVSHGGVKDSGFRETINLGGARVTPEHRIEVERDWAEASSISADAAASSFERYYGRKVRDALREREFGVERKRQDVAFSLRLRIGDGNVRVGVSEEAAKILRVQSSEGDFGIENDPRYDESPCVPRLDVDEGQMCKPETPCVEELRGSRDFSFRRVGEIVRDVLEGHGSDVSEGSYPRTRGQHEGVWAGKLHLVGAKSTSEKHSVQSYCRDPEGSNDDSRGVGIEWDRENDSLVSFSERVPEREDVRDPECVEQVYDIADCGSRRAFTVVLPDGRMVLSHNCDQAIARDILAHGMRLAAAEGIDIVFHVHDQIVGMVKEDEAEAKLKVLLDCMAVRPKWAPTIPARAAGHISKWFVKD